MRYLFGLLFAIFIYQSSHAQFTQEEKGQYTGQNITQADLDILFVNDPDLYWLDFDYKDTLLSLPDFKNLEILAINSEALQTMTFSDTLLELGLIDFNLPNLTTLSEPVAPNLFQLRLYANLPNIPMFVCSTEGLTLVHIKNYRDIVWPECMEDRFINGPFELSTCEILNGIDGETISKIVSPDNSTDEWLESSDDMTDEELRDLQKGMQRTGRMITVVRRASGLALAGILFLILKS